MSIERNDAWAAALRAGLKAVWDGYNPRDKPLVTPNDNQGDEPAYTLGELVELREAARARAAAQQLPADDATADAG